MAIAQSVVGFLLQKLTVFLQQEATLLAGVEDQVRYLERELRRMQCFLKDADGKFNENNIIKNWVNDVRELAYEAEDAIDTFIFNIERKHISGRNFMAFLSRCSSLCNELKVRHTLGNKMGCINSRIAEIQASRSTYGIENLHDGQGASNTCRKRLRDRRRITYDDEEEEEEVVGVEEVLKSLEERLIDEEDSRLTVVSIVGMGGLGKTTLAKKLFNKDNIRRYFDSCHAWVTISQEFNARDLLKMLAKKLMGLQEEETKKLDDDGELKAKLLGYLRERRYLIALDDIWKIDAWDDLKYAFPDLKNGSRILLTTRNKEVALYAQPWSPPYELRFLNDDESWDLFTKKAFPNSEEGICPSDLESFGRGMVKRCSGLPLAIIAIGGLLSMKGNASHLWEKVLKSLNWALREGPHEIKTILALSYNDLPFDLKPCFLYCGMFREDSEIDAARLIKYWVAEGFIQQRGEQAMEDVGEEILEELISRSMIQVSRRNAYGKVVSCRMHDILRDLSVFEAKEGNFSHIFHNQDQLRATRARRISITDGNFVQYAKRKHSTPHLRSFLGLWTGGVDLPKKDIRNLFAGFQLLRVLDLKGVDITSIPDKIGDLIHLRFLGLFSTTKHSPFLVSFPNLYPFPFSIAKLWNLQTLDLSSTYVGRLPTKIWETESLRHLYLSWYGTSMPNISGNSHLSNLQTLTGVNAGSWIGDQLSFLSNLRNLGIMDLSRSHKIGLCESVAKLNHLNHLELHGRDICPIPILSHLQHLYEIKLEGTLEKLHELPQNLVRLELWASRLQEDPFTTLARLPKLHTLRLYPDAYIGKELRCSVGGFPQLQLLTIIGLEELEKLSIEEGGMPNLTRLEIDICPNLKIPLEGLANMIPSSESNFCYTLVKMNP